MDMSNKTKFYKNVLNQLKSDSNSSSNSDQITLMKFLFDRVLNQNLNLEQSEKNLELATETFMKLVDESLADQFYKINKIMLVFTCATVLFLPPQVLAGLMGMNIKVPF